VTELSILLTLLPARLYTDRPRAFIDACWTATDMDSISADANAKIS